MTPLADVQFWSSVKSQFPREGIANNADWAQVVDTLDISFRDFGH
jgi:hypothetical protein